MSGSGSSGEARKLGELRRLLIGPEQEKLDAIERRLDDSGSVEELTRALPEALRKADAEGEALADALAAPVEKSLQASVQRNPQPLVDAVTPILAPAIRQMVTQQVQRMVESLNRILEQSFTVRGLTWRMEARKTGRSVAEVALLHSLQYRVEQAFLIHGPTGLLLRHVAQTSEAQENADLVSGMLTAIQDFVKDSFASSEALDRLELGELRVFLQRTGDLVLAAVVRGTPPQDLTDRLQSTLDQVSIGFRAAVQTFDGDAAPFESADTMLSACLVTKERERESGRWTPVILFGLLLLLLLGGGLYLWWTRPTTAPPGEAYAAKLRSTPGVLIVNEQVEGDRRRLTALVDPTASVPPPPPEVELDRRTYRSLDPELAITKLRDSLGPEAEVRREGQTLHVSGQAPHAAYQRARALDPASVGVTEISLAKLIDRDRAAVRAAAQKVEALTVTFDVGGDEADTSAVVEGFRLLDQRLQVVGGHAIVEVIGRADRTGTFAENQRLSVARAERVVQAVGRRERMTLVPVGFGSSRPVAGGEALNRTVGFRVSIVGAGGSEP